MRGGTPPYTITRDAAASSTELLAEIPATAPTDATLSFAAGATEGVYSVVLDIADSSTPVRSLRMTFYAELTPNLFVELDSELVDANDATEGFSSTNPVLAVRPFVNLGQVLITLRPGGGATPYTQSLLASTGIGGTHLNSNLQTGTTPPEFNIGFDATPRDSNGLFIEAQSPDSGTYSQTYKFAEASGTEATVTVFVEALDALTASPTSALDGDGSAAEPYTISVSDAVSRALIATLQGAGGIREYTFAEADNAPSAALGIDDGRLDSAGY